MKRLDSEDRENTLTENIVISAHNLSMMYMLYDGPQDRLKQSLFWRLGRNYGHSFWALRDISLEVRSGETFGIIGRNGSGKSTLLEIFAGLLQPTTGNVQISGRVAALLELGSGFNPEYTGRENIYLNGAILGLSRKEIDKKYDEIVDFADIGEFINQPVKLYSSGMYLRLAFAVQSCVDPEILIVDEAMAVGDEKFQRKCFARFEALKKKGTSILFVSHSTSQIIEFCDRALFLERGTQVVVGHPETVVRAYQRFIYSPADEQERLMHAYNSSQQQSEVAQGATRETKLAPNEKTIQGDFDPDLISETITVYPTQGAKIILFRILDMAMRPINILMQGQECMIEVSGEFLIDVNSVYFGTHIRSVSGLEITGQIYPNQGTYINRVNAGDSFRITYKLKMALLPGVYFIGGGIWSHTEPNCLHRIIDALVFRVLPNHKSNSFGFVDISSADPLFEIL